MSTRTSPKYMLAKLQARMDGAKELRQDSLKCEPGNKPCGKKCIPQDQKCSVDGSGGGITNAGKIAVFAGAGLAGGAIGFSALKIGQAVAERKRQAQLEPAEPDTISAKKNGNNIQENAPDEGMKSANLRRSSGKPKNVRTKTSPKPLSKTVQEMAKNNVKQNSTSKQNAVLREPTASPSKEAKPSLFGRFASGVKNTFKKKETPKKEKPLKSANTDSLLSRLDTFLEQRSDSPQCEAGNKPCGKRCIPQDHSCSKETTKGALNGAGHGALGMLGLVGTIANGVIGARNGGGGKGAVKAIGRGLLGPAGGAVYGGLRARGHGRVGSGIAGIATTAATTLAIGAGVHALRNTKKIKD